MDKVKHLHLVKNSDLDLNQERFQQLIQVARDNIHMKAAQDMAIYEEEYILLEYLTKAAMAYSICKDHVLK